MRWRLVIWPPVYRLIFYVLVAYSPLVLGSNRPVFWAANASLSGIMMLSLLLSERSQMTISRFNWGLPLCIVGALCVAVCWMWIQASSWTPSWLHHPIWTMGGRSENRGAISISPTLTLLSIAWMGTIAMVLSVAIRIGTNEANTRFTLVLLTIAAALNAIFGMAVEKLDLRILGLGEKQFYLGWVTGTFVNRNTAATYFAIGMIVALTLAIQGARRPEVQTRGPLHGDNAIPPLVFAVVALVLFVALLLTGSRAGVLSGGLGAASVTVLTWLTSSRRNNSTWRKVAMFAGGLGIIALSAKQLMERGDDAISSNALRLSLYQEALAAIRDRPWLGHGAGTYAEVQPLYHKTGVSSDFVWTHAHSSYLESAITLGIPITIGLLLVWGFATCLLFRFMRRASPPPVATLCCLSVTAAVAVHALVDFSLQIQAIAIAYAALFGLAIGEAVRSTSGESVYGRRQPQNATRLEAT